MLRRSPAWALVFAALCYCTCSALAQSPGPGVPLPGYWYQGKWIGYAPAHPKHGKSDDRSPGSPSEASLKGRPRAGVSVPHYDGLRLTGRESDSRKSKAAGRDLLPMQRANLPASFEESVSAEVDGAPVDQGESTWCAKHGHCEDTSAEEICYGTPWIWGRAEYLLWWTDGMKVPPLVTTGDNGVLGQPETRILSGNTGFNSDARSGGRFTLGRWLDPCQYRGVEATYMVLGEETETFSASNNDFTILARPFFNVARGGAQDARLIVSPGLIEGNVSVTAVTEFQGAEVLLRRVVERCCCSRVDFLCGYRWVQLEDDLWIDEFTSSLPPNPQADIDLFDRFDTRNSFHGGELGVSVQRQVGPCWSFEVLGKVALGNTNSVAIVNGRTTTTAIDVAVTEGGLLTQPTNIGRHERDSFATVSEFGVTLRRRFRCGLDATFGYTFVYWNDVARAGDQIDFSVDEGLFPPEPRVGTRPAFSFHTSDFWAQGLSFGLDYRF